MFHLHGDDDDDPGDDNDDSSPKIPNKFFEEMRNLKLLGLNYASLLPLPSSFPVLKNLQTLCLDGCRFKDTALIGELRTLEVLGMVNSDVEKLPKEIGRLTRLRLVDLSDCYRLEVIPAGVISNWKRLEDLRLRNSFKEWESGEVMSETSNASLLELMNLAKLTFLEVQIPNDNVLPPKFLSDRLEIYQIVVGDVDWEKWRSMPETTINQLKLKLTTKLELDQGLITFLKDVKIYSLLGREWLIFHLS